MAGARKRLYFMRERILELGPGGESYLTELIHARPMTWKGDVERLTDEPPDRLAIVDRILHRNVKG